MGLDQYLYRVKGKACKNAEELEVFLQATYHWDEEFMIKCKKAFDEGNESLFDSLYFTEHFLEKLERKEPEALKIRTVYIERFKKEIKLRKELLERYTENELENNEEEVAYWRKHSDLQGYMQKLYYARDGEKEFNCEKLTLSKEDCENVIEYAQNEIKKYNNEKNVEHTEGFFFGKTEKEDWVNTIEKFKQVIAETDFENETIYYDSWW